MAYVSRLPPVLAVFVALGAAAASLAVSAQTAPYLLAITGVPDDELRHLLEETSSLKGLEAEPPSSPVALQRRADGDRERLEAALHSEGYYDAKLDISITGPASGSGEAAKATVTVAVTPGPAYRFRRIEVKGAPPVAPLDADTLGLKPGAVARGPLVTAAEQKIKDILAAHGFAFATVPERRVVIDRETGTLDVTFTVVPGPAVRLGALRVSGLAGLDESVARNRAAWTPGQLYAPALIEKTRVDLNKLGVFASARVQVADKPDPDGTYPVTATVSERPTHFLGFGATFTNSEGLGGQAYWGHRNLFGGGEQFRVGAEVNRLNIGTVGGGDIEGTDEKITVELRKPDMWAVNQDLVLSAAALTEHPQAYQRNAITAGARLERRIDPHLTVGYGLAGEQAKIRDISGPTSATLAGSPLTMAYDVTDSLLDPTTGYRAALDLTPWARISDPGNSFMVGRVTGSAYHDLSGHDRLIAAGRLSVGSIADGALLGLPADKRFFAGGGGSIRGYAYQKVGPAENGKPVGGESLIELNMELRYKITEDIGLVPFLDGGNVYRTALPRVGQGLRFGAGLGARYYTSFGPLRLDLGVPLQPRRNDDPFQIYISLGQTF